MNERFDTFTVLIAGINRSIKKVKSKEMARWGLKSSHVSCMYYLYKNKSLTAAELCRICGEDKAGISRTIEQFEVKGYLRCFDNGRKRYRTPFELTDSGKKVGKSIVNKVDEILNLAGKGLQDEERKILYKSLRLISSNLQEICAGYGK